jgi:hypothetical protein
MPTPKRVPLGKPLPLTDEQLAALTTAEAIAPDELERQELDIFWRKVVPAILAYLLLAKLLEDEETPIDAIFGWAALTGKYYSFSANGFIDFLFIRDNGIENIVNSIKADMGSLTDQLIARQISLAEWQSGMMELIKDGNNLAGVAARGGWAQMSPADWGAVGNATREQYEYLRNFAEEIANGKQPLNGSARVRAQLYADAIETQYERFRRRNEQLYNGAEQERRVLDPQAESCQTRGDLEGCIELSALGWQQIHSLPPIGHSPCIVRCRCHFIYRKSVGGKWVILGE